MSGITFSPTLESMIGVANNDFWSQERFCDDTDVLDLGAKVKHVDIMSKLGCFVSLSVFFVSCGLFVC